MSIKLQEDTGYHGRIETVTFLDNQQSSKNFVALQNFNIGVNGQIIQEAQGLGALLDKMDDNDHTNWITQISRCIFHSKTCRFRDTNFLKI